MFIGEGVVPLRDLVSQPLVIAGVVQEGYAHLQLGGKSVAQICEKGGKHCVQDLLVKDLRHSNLLPYRVLPSESNMSRGVACCMS